MSEPNTNDSIARLKMLEELHQKIAETEAAPEPTEAVPGSIDKLDIMAQRLTNGQELHNPHDCQGAMQAMPPEEIRKQRRADQENDD